MEIRGPKQLKAVGSAHVKSKGAVLLIEDKPLDARFKITESSLTKIVEKWEDSKQQEMKKEGLESKAMSNLSVDRQKNQDLERLK